ncbi:hypothetical protein GCM10009665_32740 [Kitasatospora nipponensis]|uniref:Signal peptidase I n=1 Tax=Kitasatospora nipponensis TaxID=258049 RepID=A0ABN1W841_9ACTN
MSTYEPIADRDGTTAPTGAGPPSRSAAVSGPEPAGGPGAEDAPEDSPGAEPPVADPARPPAGEGTDQGWRVRDLVKIGALCLLTLFLVNAFVAQPFVVPSASMENALRPGDRLLVDKLAYQFGGSVERGDVVVFDGTDSFVPGGDTAPGLGEDLHRLGSALGLAPSNGTVFVKRVIGVGGDRVTYRAGDQHLTVNGVPLAESDYLFPGEAPSTVGFDVLVPAGKLWVMGDHRADSSDSRDHLGDPGGGFVPERKVIGRADWVVFPVGHWSSLERPAGFAAVASATPATAAAAAGGTGGHGHQG